MPSPSRPTILFVSHTGNWGGGGEVVLEQTIQAAVELGYEAVLAAPAGEIFPKLAHYCRDVVVLPFSALRRTKNPARLAAMTVGWVQIATRLRRAIRSAKPAVVYANSGVAALVCCAICKLTDTPLIWHQHDIIPYRRVNQAVLLPCAKLCARIVAVSDAVAQSLQRLGVPRTKITVLHNAVRPEFFEDGPGQARARMELGLPADGFIALVAGRIVPYKGHRVFLEAIAQLSNDGIHVTGCIAGRVPDYEPPDIDPFPGYEAELQDSASRPELAGRVVFLGQQTDLRQSLAAADILVVPSINEPFPLVVLEGMANGIPVIASDSGGHPEAIEHQVSGLLVTTGDARAFASAIRSVIENREFGSALAMEARSRAASRFSTPTFTRALVDIFSNPYISSPPQ